MAASAKNSTVKDNQRSLASKLLAAGVLWRGFFLLLGIASLSLAASHMLRGEFTYYTNNHLDPGIGSFVPLAGCGAFFIYFALRRKKTAGKSEDQPSGGRNSSEGS